MTTRITPRTWNVGELVTKAIMDAHIRDQFNALWPYTAAGQIALSTASDELSKLEASGNTNKIIVSNGTTFTLIDDTKWIPIILNTDTPLTSGDDKLRFPIAPVLNGYSLVSIVGFRQSGTGTLTIQLNNHTLGQDILTTRLTIDSGETSSITAATPVVINTSYDHVASYDIIAVDVDDAGTNTLHCSLLLGYQRF